MLPLNLPACSLKITNRENKQYVLDLLRKKYILLTPEEWVRQHFIHFLIKEKGFPPALMVNEVTLNLNNTKRRCDTLVYSKTLNPLLIVEYKAATVNITQEVFNQITRYNMVLKVPFLVVTNGIRHFCCQIDYQNNTYSFLSEIPDYKTIIE